MTAEGRPKKKTLRPRLTHEEIVALIAKVEGLMNNPESGSNGLNKRSRNRIMSVYGTSAEYSIYRMLRRSPEVIERLRSGEIKSISAAMEEAGLLERFVSIPTGDAERAARTILKNVSPANAMEIAKLIAESQFTGIS